MKEKIIAVDLDGTLTLNNACLSEYTIRGIQEISKLKDYKVIITTGRTWLGTRDPYNASKLNTPVVCYSGAFVYIPSENKILNDVRIEKESLFEMLENEEFRSMLDFIRVEYIDKSATLSNLSNITIKEVKEFEENLSFTPTSLIVAVNKPENQEKMKAFMAKTDKFAYRYWGYRDGEVYHKEVSKINGIDKVLEYYHTTKDDLIFFGDSQNDVEIIQYANTGVAMLNAAAYIRDMADEVTEYTNNEDGVIKHLFKKLKINK